MSIILASASPRRSELLRQLNLEFTVAPMEVDETWYPKEPAQDYALRIANAKAIAACREFSEGEVIIAADTVVSLEDRVFGKPRNRAHGLQMLADLSGHTHIVYTAVVVSQGEKVVRARSCTEVSFREIAPDEALRYWQSGEPQDKAGGYAIQGLGAMFVSEIRGSYSGVVGLPLFELTQLLQEFAVEPLNR